MYLHDLIEHLLDYNKRHVGPGFVGLLKSEYKDVDPHWYLVPAHTPGAIGKETVPGNGTPFHADMVAKGLLRAVQDPTWKGNPPEAVTEKSLVRYCDCCLNTTDCACQVFLPL